MKKEQYIDENTVLERAEEWISAVKPYIRARWEPVAAQTAIIIVDAQRYFFNEDFHGFIPASSAILPNLIKLAQRGAKIGAKVIATRHAEIETDFVFTMHQFWDDTIYDGTLEAELISPLKRLGLPIVRKSTYDAFWNTDLEEMLREWGIEWIAIAGVMTDLCCETTARSAFVRGFMPIFIADATATVTEELHLSTLRTLAHGFAKITTTKMFLESLK